MLCLCRDRRAPRYSRDGLSRCLCRHIRCRRRRRRSVCGRARRLEDVERSLLTAARLSVGRGGDAGLPEWFICQARSRPSRRAIERVDDRRRPLARQAPAPSTSRACSESNGADRGPGPARRARGALRRAAPSDRGRRCSRSGARHGSTLVTSPNPSALRLDEAHRASAGRIVGSVPLQPCSRNASHGPLFPLPRRPPLEIHSRALAALTLTGIAEIPGVNRGQLSLTTAYP